MKNPIAPRTRRRRLPYDPGIICLDRVTADFVYREVFVEEVYLRNGIAIEEGSTVFDVGANIGLFSLFCLRNLQDVRIYAFEPVPEIHECLRANLEGRGAPERQAGGKGASSAVFCHLEGLGDRDGGETINFYPRISADSAIVPFDFEEKVASYVANYRERVGGVLGLVPRRLRRSLIRWWLRRTYTPVPRQCRLSRFSTVLGREGVERVDLLKIDAENYEWPVLMGIDREDWPRIRQIAMEVHEHVPGGERLTGRIGALLTEKGFSVTYGSRDGLRKWGVIMLYAARLSDSRGR